MDIIKKLKNKIKNKQTSMNDEGKNKEILMHDEGFFNLINNKNISKIKKSIFWYLNNGEDWFNKIKEKNVIPQTKKL